MSTTIELIILGLLILLNGILAMAEMAVVSASPVRLEKLASEDNRPAQVALDLTRNPNRFLSTVQVGISLIAIVSGAFGGASFSDEVAEILLTAGVSESASSFLGYGLVVGTITYFSLLLGELVPKRLALSDPDTISMLIALPMQWLSLITRPIVIVLGFSTEFFIRLFGINPNNSDDISEDEIRLLVAQGTRSGVIEPTEKDLVFRVFQLDDQIIKSLMTPRPNITWINPDDDIEALNEQIRNSGFSYFPAFKNQQENILGVVSAKQVLAHVLMGDTIPWQQLVRPALFVPENTTALNLLNIFRREKQRVALVIDEYGTVQGLISLSDVLEAIVGEDLQLGSKDFPTITARNNQSWLVDGMLDIDEFESYFSLNSLPQHDKDDFHTVGGYVMSTLGHIPKLNDQIELQNLKLEVIDMDGMRVDKLLVSKMPMNSEGDTSPEKGG